MRKKYIFFFFFFAIRSVCAQDLDVSLFDDTPNLGRDSQPLDSLRLTPPPAPDIRIELDNSTSTPPAAPEPTQPVIPPPPSSPITLSEQTATPEQPTTETKPKTELPRIYKNVALFKVAGLKLGESATKALKKARQKGFKVVSTQEEVPLYYATNYAYKCRQNGFITPDKLSQCIKDYACHEETRYISQATLAKKNVVLTLYFTSKLTKNVLYKIVFLDKGDPSLNFTHINRLRKLTRQKEFWNAVFDKYGAPDDETKYTWGNPEKAYLKAYMAGSAYDAYLIMEDVSLFNDDYYAADDKEKARPPKNKFAF